MHGSSVGQLPEAVRAKGSGFRGATKRDHMLRDPTQGPEAFCVLLKGAPLTLSPFCDGLLLPSGSWTTPPLPNGSSALQPFSIGPCLRSVASGRVRISLYLLWCSVRGRRLVTIAHSVSRQMKSAGERDGGLVLWLRSQMAGTSAHKADAPAHDGLRVAPANSIRREDIFEEQRLVLELLATGLGGCVAGFAS